jgi:hypothetical protein
MPLLNKAFFSFCPPVSNGLIIDQQQEICSKLIYKEPKKHKKNSKENKIVI